MKADIYNQAMAGTPIVNYHERTNGIRWSLFLVLLIACGYLLTGRMRPENAQQTSLVLCFCAIAVFAFLLSMPPVIFGLKIGPSGWIYKLIHQYRVPGRAGFMVHFAILVLAGQFLNRHLRPSWHWLTPLIVVLEFPPFLNALPLSPVSPRYESLQVKSANECGTGVYFPYASNQWELKTFYVFMQRMRGSPCPFINANSGMPREDKMLDRFALHPTVLQWMHERQARFTDPMVKLFQCLGLSWIAFDPNVEPTYRSEFCEKLGWKMTESDVCRSPNPKVLAPPLKMECFDIPKTE